MKLGTHIFSEVLNQIISIFWPNQPKKHFKELFRYAENLTCVVEPSILPLKGVYRKNQEDFFFSVP